MTTHTALEERVFTLEDFIDEQVPATMTAMKAGMTGLHAQLAENNEAIALLRHDITAHRHGLDERYSGLRMEVAVASAPARRE